MENKIFKFKDSEFTMIEDNLLLGKRGDKLMLKYAALQEEYTGDIDFSLIDSYEDRISELTTAVEQCEDETLKKEYQQKLDKITEEYNSNPRVKSKLKRKAIAEGLMYRALMRDMEFNKNLFQDILKGNHEELDYSDADAINKFTLEVFTFFLPYFMSGRLQ